jgi:arginine utilization regulatory protein
LNAYEKELLVKVLKKNDWNITRSAKLLGMSRQNLQYRLRKLNIEV